MLRVLFAFLVLICYLPQSRADESSRDFALKIIKLEMQIVGMLNDSRDSKSHEEIVTAHHLFDERYAELTALKNEMSAKFPEINLESYIEEIIQTKILMTEAHIDAVLNQDLTGQPASTIQQSGQELESALAEFKQLTSVLEQRRMVRDLNPEQKFSAQAKDDSAEPATETLDEPQNNSFLVEDAKNLEILKKAALNPHFADQIRSAIIEFRIRQPLSRDIVFAQTDADFVEASANLARLTVDQNYNFKNRHNKRQKVAQNVNEFRQDQFMQTQAALAAQQSFLKATNEHLENAAEIFGQLLEKRAKKIKKSELHKFTESRRYEFRDALALVTLYAQALQRAPLDSPQASLLREAMSVASIDFVKRTQRILTFTDLTFQGAMTAIRSDIQLLLPSRATQAILRDSIIKSRSELNYYEAYDATRMGSPASRLVSKLMYWGLSGSVFAMANTLLWATMGFKHGAAVVATTTIILLMMKDNFIKQMFVATKDAWSDRASQQMLDNLNVKVPQKKSCEVFFK